MRLSNGEIQKILHEGQLRESEQKILIYLERYGVGEFPLAKELKKKLPNTNTIREATNLSPSTTSLSLQQLNLLGYIVYTRLGMQKKAILTEKGASLVSYIKEKMPLYYIELHGNKANTTNSPTT